MEGADLQLAEKVYAGLEEKIKGAREKLGRPLTLAEKILFSHLAKWPDEELERGESHLNLLPTFWIDLQ